MLLDYEHQKPAKARRPDCGLYFGDAKHLSCFGRPMSEVPYKKAAPLSVFTWAVKIARGQQRATA